MSSIERCSICKYFILDEDLRPGKPEHVAFGECHRHAPHASLSLVKDNGDWIWAWPEILGNDWCGEFEVG